MGASRLDNLSFSRAALTPVRASFPACQASEKRLEDAQGAAEGRNMRQQFPENGRQTARPDTPLPSSGLEGSMREPAQGSWRTTYELKQVEKLVHRHVGAADQRSQGPQRELLMLGDREVDPDARLDQHEMAADLTDGLP